jgi:hypothetical protein
MLHTPATRFAAATRPAASLIREAFWLEWMTVGWMTIEAIVAIAWDGPQAALF